MSGAHPVVTGVCRHASKIILTQYVELLRMGLDDDEVMLDDLGCDDEVMQRFGYEEEVMVDG